MEELIINDSMQIAGGGGCGFVGCGGTCGLN